MMTQIPASDRPRERCLTHGASTLSLRECLAILIGSGPRQKGCLGLADDILARCSSAPEDRLFFQWIQENPLGLMQGIKGLGQAHKARLLVAWELGNRLAQFKLAKEEKGSDGHHVGTLEKKALSRIGTAWRTMTKEWIGFVPIDMSYRVGDFILVERGTRSDVNFDTTSFFALLLTVRPAAFVLVHNHPSGNLQPSEEDVFLTNRIRTLADQFDVELLAHWVVTSSGEQRVE